MGQPYCVPLHFAFCYPIAPPVVHSLTPTSTYLYTHAHTHIHIHARFNAPDLAIANHPHHHHHLSCLCLHSLRPAPSATPPQCCLHLRYSLTPAFFPPRIRTSHFTMPPANSRNSSPPAVTAPLYTCPLHFYRSVGVHWGVRSTRGGNNDS